VIAIARLLTLPRASIFVSSMKLLSQFATLYKDNAAFPEIFAGALSVLKHAALDTTKIGAALKSEASAIAAQIEAGKDHHLRRPPLRLQTRKPTQIKEAIPRFNEKTYVTKKDQDPDRARAEEKKLKRALKSETKGAMRELKKDNMFLAQARMQKEMERRSVRDSKTKTIMNMLKQQNQGFGGSKKRKN
jgi:nucleolar protein 14